MLSFSTSGASPVSGTPNVVLQSAVATREEGTRDVTVTLTLSNTGGAPNTASFKMVSLLGRHAVSLPPLDALSGQPTVTIVLTFPPSVPSSSGNLNVYIVADGVTYTRMLTIRVP